MNSYSIAELGLTEGLVGIAAMPGRGGTYSDDLASILDWGPGLVLTMTTSAELAANGAASLGPDLEAAGIGWHHLAVDDFASPGPDTTRLWTAAALEAHRVLGAGGRVLAHCFGGCGRSGMALLRLMVEAGEDPDAALARLREARPCAVETDEQKAWATTPS